MKTYDYKKAFKALYQPVAAPADIVVPAMSFLMVDGKGDPNEPDGDFGKAVGLLYVLAYTIKMSGKGDRAPVGYFEYVVPPLEGLWWYDDGGPFRFGGKANFCWTAMIRQPEFVTPEVFDWACREAVRKKPGLDTSAARFAVLEEGLCVQCLHLGPYDDEPATVARMEAYMLANGFAQDFSDARRHHEIYLGDPRKSDPAKMKTIVRHPVKRVR